MKDSDDASAHDGCESSQATVPRNRWWYSTPARQVQEAFLQHLEKAQDRDCNEKKRKAAKTVSGYNLTTISWLSKDNNTGTKMLLGSLFF